MVGLATQFRAGLDPDADVRFDVHNRYIVLDRFGEEGESHGIAGRLTILLNW